MERTIQIGKHIIPLWLIGTLLLSGIGVGVLANYIWTTIIIPLEVKEPLEILAYPSKLSLYPADTEEFNVTVMNHHSRDYTVILDFSLDNTTYQDSYVTFSNETYTVIPDEQNLTAWLKVEAYAPPINASLTIDFHRIAGVGELVFFDDFNDGVADGWTVQLGNFEVIDGEYYTENDLGEKSITTVDDLIFTDCIIEVNLRFEVTEVGYMTGIVFRYTDNQHHYILWVDAEDGSILFAKFTPEHSHYPIELEGTTYPFEYDTDYSVKVEVRGHTFTAFLDGVELFSSTDYAYTEGQVGLRGQRADVFFDNFTVYSTP